ncbi:hypothetical protein [Vibrio coralliilyticus]|uniref:Uncharacterized protein n=1 Tax=Vibrio coralliilyticus TaxID=190893 RepID=A0AAP7DET8_9VIBR|nr:hypothetical protein [Vibrio coralliilyticus]NOJ24247.1 hypothetical protein [Vibrio coralliilyticus]
MMPTTSFSTTLNHQNAACSYQATDRMANTEPRVQEKPTNLLLYNSLTFRDVQNGRVGEEAQKKFTPPLKIQHCWDDIYSQFGIKQERASELIIAINHELDKTTDDPLQVDRTLDSYLRKQKTELLDLKSKNKTIESCFDFVSAVCTGSLGLMAASYWKAYNDWDNDSAKSAARNITIASSAVTTVLAAKTFVPKYNEGWRQTPAEKELAFTEEMVKAAKDINKDADNKVYFLPLPPGEAQFKPIAELNLPNVRLQPAEQGKPEHTVVDIETHL